MFSFNCCGPHAGEPNCGSAAGYAVRTLLAWLFSLLFGAVLIGLILNQQANPASFVMPLLPGFAPGAGLVLAVIGVVVGIPLALFVLYRLFIWWLKRMLCPVFCPIAAALRQVMAFIDAIIQQIDGVTGSIASFAVDMQTAFTNLGNVAIPDIPAMTKPLSDAAALLPNIGNLVPKIIDEAAMNANHQVDQLYANFSSDVGKVIGNLNALAVPLNLVSSGLASVRSFIGLAASALENFCCCCGHGKEQKYPHPKQ
jgi:hypothetical protein